MALPLATPHAQASSLPLETTSLEGRIEAHLATLATNHQLRTLPSPTLPPHTQPCTHTAASKTLDFTSNDYLGLSQHPALIQAAMEAAQHWGVGSTGSRLLSGNNCPLLAELETTLAHTKKQAAALVMASGFQANATVLPALLNTQLSNNKPPLVFCDRLIHASLWDGILASSARWHRYQHNDMTHLETLLQRHAQPNTPMWIITESVFSMDGDIAVLQTLQQLAQRYNAALYLDEAHATGLFGPNGTGLSTTVDWDNVPLITMSTFSKALGGMGAYVTCSHTVKHYLINHCRGLIYSTAPSPIQIATALAAWQLLPNMETQRKHVFGLARQLSQKLQALCQNTPWHCASVGESPIVPLVVGQAESVLWLKAQLEQRYNLRVAAIRPPTVPPHTARLRFTLTANHTSTDINRLTEALTATLPTLSQELPCHGG